MEKGYIQVKFEITKDGKEYLKKLNKRLKGSLRAY